MFYDVFAHMSEIFILGEKNMNDYVIITGASRGIGKETAKAFAKKGFNLILTCHKNKEFLNSVAEDCRALGVSCELFTGDVGDHDFCRAVYNFIEENGIRVKYLVNNAGISYVGLLQDMSIDDWNRVVNTNLTSVFSMSSGIIPHFLKNGEGKIINISSVWGNTGASCEVAYSATKGGINSFTKALAKELAPSNIQVNAIAFGAVDTDMNRCFSDEELKELETEIPAGRMATASEAAEMILSVAFSGPYLTGQVITFDGGWM